MFSSLSPWKHKVLFLSLGTKKHLNGFIYAESKGEGIRVLRVQNATTPVVDVGSAYTCVSQRTPLFCVIRWDQYRQFLCYHRDIKTCLRSSLFIQEDESAICRDTLSKLLQFMPKRIYGPSNSNMMLPNSRQRGNVALGYLRLGDKIIRSKQVLAILLKKTIFFERKRKKYFV